MFYPHKDSEMLVIRALPWTQMWPPKARMTFSIWPLNFLHFDKLQHSVSKALRAEICAHYCEDKKHRTRNEQNNRDAAAALTGGCVKGYQNTDLNPAFKQSFNENGNK